MRQFTLFRNVGRELPLVRALCLLLRASCAAIAEFKQSPHSSAHYQAVSLPSRDITGPFCVSLPRARTQDAGPTRPAALNPEAYATGTNAHISPLRAAPALSEPNAHLGATCHTRTLQARPGRRTLIVAAGVDFSVRPYTLRKGDSLESIAKKRGKREFRDRDGTGPDLHSAFPDTCYSPSPAPPQPLCSPCVF